MCEQFRVEMVELLAKLEAANKFSAGLEINLAAVIQRAEAAEKALAEAAEDTADFAFCMEKGALPRRSYMTSAAYVLQVGDEYGNLVTLGTGDTPRAAIRAARGKV